MKNIFIKVLTILLLNSCVSTQKSINDHVILRILHGGCYGTCPIYTISLYDNARVVYHGKRFTEHLGLYESHINRIDFKEVLLLSDKNFTSSEDVNMEVQDLPRTTINYKGNKIQFKGTTPEKYEQSILMIEHTLLKCINWDK